MSLIDLYRQVQTSPLVQEVKSLEMKGGGGSGGSMGVTEFPEYQKNEHKVFLKTLNRFMGFPGEPGDVPFYEGDPNWSVDEYLSQTALSDDRNPYVNAFTYDPRPDLEEILSRGEFFTDTVDALNEVADWGRLREVAVEALETDRRFNYPAKFSKARQIGDVDTRLNYERMKELADQLWDLDNLLDYDAILKKATATMATDEYEEDARTAFGLARKLTKVDIEMDWPAIFREAQELAADAGTDWEGLVERVLAKVNDAILSEATIVEAVDAFEQEALEDLGLARARMNASLADINAVNGSSFALAQAYLENRHRKGVRKFESELRLQRDRDRTEFVKDGVRVAGELAASAARDMRDTRKAKVELLIAAVQLITTRLGLLLQAIGEISKLAIAKIGATNAIIDEQKQIEDSRYDYLLKATGQMGQFENFALSHESQSTQELERLLLARVTAVHQSAALTGDFRKINIVGRKEWLAQELDLLVRQYEWPLEIMQYPGNLLGSPVGTESHWKEKTQDGGGAASGLGSAIGAVAGGLLGLIGGPAGAAAGASVGAGIGGSIGGMFG